MQDSKDVEIRQITNEELINLFSKSATGKPIDAHKFFGLFTYNVNLRDQKFLLAFDNIVLLLQKLKHLDKRYFIKIHKGVPYYFAGLSAFFLHNYEIAVYFFDAAVSEDLKNDPKSRTPAFMFIELDGHPDNQAAKQLVQVAEKQLTRFIKKYNKTLGSFSIKKELVRSKFLCRATRDKQEWRTLATALISFLLELDFLVVLQDVREIDGTWEPLMTHLFKGCLLFESLLKNNPTINNPGNTIGEIINLNSNIRNKLGFQKKIKTYGPKFNDVLKSLPNAPKDIFTDIEFVARLRNTLGHNLGWATPIGPKHYKNLVARIMNSILHAISVLY